METGPRDESQPPFLTRSDAWLLAALTEASHDGRPVTLRDLIDGADWLNRALPTFDELSFGLPRLIAAGFLTVDSTKQGPRFRATPKAVNLRRSIKAETLGDVLSGIVEAVGAKPYPEPEDRAEDRTLGRLRDLEPDDLETVIRQHGSERDAWLKPFITAAQAFPKWQNRRS